MDRRDVGSLDDWDPILFNYARAMEALDALPVSNRNSWRFLGGIHGCNPNGWATKGVIDAPGDVPPELASPAGPYGRQCQHQSWYFLPWHRGYVAAFEAIIAAKVKELTGDDWALPYWNYLDDSNPDALKVPRAFLDATMPDGTPNPLVKYRADSHVTSLPAPQPGRFSLESMAENDFLVGVTGAFGFGGGITERFAHFGGMTGDLELNPHNIVHVDIGGFMRDPAYAALDPIFWLHHCNIDRLWEAWMQTSGKHMTNDPRWLNGPDDRDFLMPSVGGSDPGTIFSAIDTMNGGSMYPSYDNLTKGTGVTPGAAIMAHVPMGSSQNQTVEPIGANDSVIDVGATATHTGVQLDPVASNEAVTTMGVTEPGRTVSRVYLALEGVRGSGSPVVEVYLGTPDGEAPSAGQRAGTIAMFGLGNLSDPDGDHAGGGANYKLDITDLAIELREAGRLVDGQVPVALVRESGSEGEAVRVDRVVVYRRTGTVE